MEVKLKEFYPESFETTSEENPIKKGYYVSASQNFGIIKSSR
jgi:hypothetical protein